MTKKEILKKYVLPEDLLAAAKTFAGCMERGSVCVLGPQNKLEQSELLQRVETL